MTTPAPNDPPVGPYQVPISSVYALAPEAPRLTDPGQSKLGSPITEDTVRGWIADVSAAVAAALGDYSRLAETQKATIGQAARTVVATGAAHYLEAARYPTRAALNDSSYPGMLWARYQAGLSTLSGRVEEWLNPPDSGGDGAGAPATGPFGSFPTTTYGDGMAW